MLLMQFSMFPVAVACYMLVQCTLNVHALTTGPVRISAADTGTVHIATLTDVPTHSPAPSLLRKEDPLTESNPENLTSRVQSIDVPTLSINYELVLSVNNVYDGEEYEVKEREKDGRAHHSLISKNLNISCLFDTTTSEGYTVDGVKCGRRSKLPQKCFCSDRYCRPYVTVGSILSYLAMNNATMSEVKLGVAQKFFSWRVNNQIIEVEAVFSQSEKYSVGADMAPHYFSVRGSGSVFLSRGGSVSLEYRVQSLPTTVVSVQDLMVTPNGVFCPSHERKYLPKLANQFTLTMETIIENVGTIAYEHQSYDSEEKLVSYTYRPHLHAQEMFFVRNTPGMTEMSSVETFRVIHDFRTGIQYMINEKTTNCSIQGIPLSAVDGTPTEKKSIRLRHASELISLDPHQFIYKGTRVVRGILCDVWVADRGTRKKQYTTVEIFFTHKTWTVEIEVLNKRRQVPVGISTYIAQGNNPKEWTSKVHTFFYEFSDAHPSWERFNISPCLNRINRLFLMLTLEVSYSELVHYNLEVAKNSIRSAVAGIAGVSPLRITDLFLSSRHSTGEVDVWFVLLEKPDVAGSVSKPRPQLMMADAYRLLHDVTNKHNLSVKLDLSANKKLFVTIKCGSLETTSGALHPNMRHKSLRFIQAGYTAGSMAGLGFSMAILGTCIGIFIGFLLWKHSPSIPYIITD